MQSNSKNQGRTPAHPDATVIEVALVDLLTYAGDDSPVTVLARPIPPPTPAPAGSRAVPDLEKVRRARPRLPPAHLWFAADAATRPQTMNEVLYQDDKKRWASLSPGEMGATREAAMDLIRRLSARDRFRRFTPKDRRIRVVAGALPKNTRQPNDPDRPIQAWTPGYSRNGDLALVRLIVPWNNNQAETTYLLGRRPGAWVVLLRQFAYTV